jgi:hypothetical protein
VAHNSDTLRREQEGVAAGVYWLDGRMEVGWWAVGCRYSKCCNSATALRCMYVMYAGMDVAMALGGTALLA